MIRIINWTAKRAGGRITVYGVNQESGEPIKVVGVDQITKTPACNSPFPIATDRNNELYELA